MFGPESVLPPGAFRRGSDILQHEVRSKKSLMPEDGNGDVGRNVTDPSKALEAVTRNQFRVMAGVLAEDASRSREEAVQQRLRLIESIVPAGREIKLIINNGGGTVASGGADG